MISVQGVLDLLQLLSTYLGSGASSGISDPVRAFNPYAVAPGGAVNQRDADASLTGANISTWANLGASSFLGDHSGVISVSVANAPAATVKYRWRFLGQNRVIETASPDVDVYAFAPGPCTLIAEAIDAGGGMLKSVPMRLSVPFFVVVVSDPAKLSSAFAREGLSGADGDTYIRLLRFYTERILRQVNVRMVWRVPPFNEALPPQFDETIPQTAARELVASGLDQAVPLEGSAKEWLVEANLVDELKGSDPETPDLCDYPPCGSDDLPGGSTYLRELYPNPVVTKGLLARCHLWILDPRSRSDVYETESGSSSVVIEPSGSQTIASGCFSAIADALRNPSIGAAEAVRLKDLYMHARTRRDATLLAHEILHSQKHQHNEMRTGEWLFANGPSGTFDRDLMNTSAFRSCEKGIALRLLDPPNFPANGSYDDRLVSSAQPMTDWIGVTAQRQKDWLSQHSPLP